MFDALNELVKAGVDQFRLQSFDSSRLLIVGSFDLCYYHNVEVIFTEVTFIRCASFFWATEFRSAGDTEDGKRIEIIADDVFEIVAASVEIKMEGGDIVPWVTERDSV